MTPMLRCRYCHEQVGPAGQCGCHCVDDRAVVPDPYITEEEYQDKYRPKRT